MIKETKVKIKESELYRTQRTDHIGIGLHHEASKAKAAAVLTKEAADEQELYTFQPEPYKHRPWDGAAACGRAVIRMFGQEVTGNERPGGFFGPGEKPSLHTITVQDMMMETPYGEVYQRHHMLSEDIPLHDLVGIAVKCGVTVPSPYGEEHKAQIAQSIVDASTVIDSYEYKIQVPWGNVTIYKDGREWGTAELSGAMSPDYGPLFVIAITTRKANAAEAQALAALIDEELKVRSIYKGRCLDSTKDDPSFWNPFQIVQKDKVILSDVNINSIQGLILNPIKYRERAERRNKRLLKRTYLWPGEYGTGKSVSMVLMAQFALMHGWTVIRCAPGDSLERTMQLARLLEPAVVLIEDAEIFSASGDKETVSKLLDEFDGMLAKGGRVITIMTTNHVGEVTKGMTRPGRIDGMMFFEALDRKGVEKLYKVWVGENLAGFDPLEDLRSKLFDIEERPIQRANAVDWDAVWAVTSDYTPAFHAEVLARTESFALNQDIPFVTTEDLVGAGSSLQRQFGLYQKADEPVRTDATIETAIGTKVADVLSGHKVILPSGDAMEIISK